MMTAPPLTSRFLRVHGVVQGVGFRPFVHRLATRLSLAGWVRNAAGTVEVRLEGDEATLDEFERCLRSEAPPLSRIDAVERESSSVAGLEGFSIGDSTDAESARPVPADAGICAACAAELADPKDRRHRHPFITCVNCGPRYTVIDALPYDRARTSMRAFPLCPSCGTEYTAPADRRFHAETIACSSCGPTLWLEEIDGRRPASGDGALRLAATALRVGAILGLRGLGGFHLAVDATNDAAVRRLRERKHREGKPLAVMVRDLAEVRALCEVNEREAALLVSAARPIVLLKTREGSALSTALHPGLDVVGVMLAYTPMHLLLLESAARPLVMTSGNLSDEPIAIGLDEGRERLAGIADLFLMHDREILSRIDDSVTRVVGRHEMLVRRARGYAPLPVHLPRASREPIIAVGPHLKNTFTLVRGAQAFVSPHIGDLEDLTALAHWQATYARYRDLFRVEPTVVARDLHPGYLSTRIADELGLAREIVVQHHHAHIAAVMAEHGVRTPVLGLAFDGTGLGDDDATWGAEALVADLRGYRRVGQLRYAAMPGGDLAAREPWRCALAYEAMAGDQVRAFGLAWYGVPMATRAAVTQQLARGVNSPRTSSMGRLFDAAAAVLGVRRHATFEGQAAMELEAMAGSLPATPLPFPIVERDGMLELDPVPLLVALGEGRQHGVDVHLLAARFHEGVAHAAAELARRAAQANGLKTVALGGGSWQNARLLASVEQRLVDAGFEVLVPRLLPPNDGGVSYGQAAVAAWTLTEE